VAVRERKETVSTPRFRHWVRSSGPKVASGLLIGFGILTLVLTLFLKPGSYTDGFPFGIILTVMGAAGLIISSSISTH
jgi:hypothetical protein